MAQTGSARVASAPALCAAAVALLALIAPSGADWAFSNTAFKIGLPQVAAALLLGGLAFALVYVREWKTAARLAQLRQALEAREPAAGEDMLGVLETAAQALRSELKHQAGLAQGILGGLPMPFLLVDEQERAVCSNQDCLNMLELSGKPEDYYGQTLAQIFYNDPGRKTAVGRSIKDGEVFRNLEVEIKGHRGGVRNVLANVFPLYDSDKRCLGGLCLYLDMTLLKQKEQVIVQKNTAIERTAQDADALCRRLREASARLGASIAQTTSGSAAQKSRVAEIGVSMEQMSEAVVDVARSAAGASTGAEEARRLADEGARAVTDVIAAIGDVSARTSAMRDRLGELDSQVAGIGQILNVISDIADQTNLLALNAAIEAARAGDAGRGFAVVADEVRKLAEKTQRATSEVGSAIGSVQEGARRVVEGMSGAAQAVERSTALADGAGGSLREILRLSQGSADQVRSIATASEEQSSAAEEISRSVDEVRGVSEHIAQDMDHAALAVEDLTRLFAELEELIKKMQVC
ncbi:MAG TPA: methyl-accepting chemotaxis protein [Humidesulfovibrio sp.]|uniref:methyl-accepting chemotaxis protein n=1 Tax=Humidesulfovibrio sp. TaxID=2910988 RepID=UPI002D040B8C|nr:methyl-accepting chemotaxis protein [Humidesulfovibrio sp.]HWR02913.1 methyl-accepting chemotaxis protein [Humidesulfovibrio sp.]